MIPVLTAAVLVTLLAACTPAAGGATSAPTTSTVGLDDLRRDIAEVAAAHAETDRRLADLLDDVRRVDDLASRLRTPAGVEAALVDSSAIATPGRGADRSLAASADLADAATDARRTLNRVRETRDDGWEARYLDAEAAVLDAVGRYARVAAELAGTIRDHLDTYVDLVEEVQALAGDLPSDRPAAEAADTARRRLRAHQDAHAAAREAIERARDARERAGAEVNAVTGVAAEVYASRPGARGGSSR